MTRPLFLSRGGLISTHRPATPKPTPKPKGSIAPAYIAAGTLVLLTGASTEAVLSASEGHWAAAGACVVADVLTLVFYGLAARRSHRKADQAQPVAEPDEHEDAVLWLGDVDPEYAAHQRAYAAMPDKHTVAAKREFDAMQRVLHERLKGVA